ncbi:hypothetical protein [Pelagerythrobacter rhizovicinus]|uniref:HEAT repeat domain-containing protein n=1 Tax=Pelagerythrobacter rhizovicinus TaxID=2268576 RepID=A0A4Q2KKR6_9SPHN|nr:hypothetical protein [Pelagerythrobacter rhizovicinus]RXZ65895.1 hypothetical protein ETX26_03995 [Pelagerythrobacter rhizovicinus]
MRIDPAIEALRENAALQHRAQAELERIKADWLIEPRTAAMLRALERYDRGARLADCPPLAALVAETDVARSHIDALTGAMIEGLRENPLGHVPFRHRYGDGLAVLQLAQSGRATLSLMLYAPPESEAPPASVCFTDGERHEICLAGAAEARRVSAKEGQRNRAELTCKTIRIAAGTRLSFAGLRETKLVDRVEGRLVLLRLARQAAAPRPSVEYRLSDGALLHRAAGACDESRRELMLALLGAMQREDAVPAIARLVRTGSDSLRWQALRECLALDSAAGFRELSQLARDAADPLHGPACALRTELLAGYPQLAAAEGEHRPCRA